MFSTKTIPFKLKNRNNYRTIDKYHFLTTNLKTLLRISIKKKKKKEAYRSIYPQISRLSFQYQAGLNRLRNRPRLGHQSRVNQRNE